MDFLKFVAALAFVLALMGGLALVLKRLNLGQTQLSPTKKRLKTLEILPLDARRKLVLLQRDNIQHLVILGPSGETVIESGIIAPHETPEKSQDSQPDA